MSSPTRRHFTQAARAAALESRRRKREQKVQPDLPEVFVVRRAENERRFEWQIRRFGGVTLDRSSEMFDSVQAAQIAGRQALKVFASVTGRP